MVAFRLCAALSILYVVAQALATSLKQVDLGYAKYQSNLSLEPGVTSFLGIRYAAPPTGQLRWRKPQLPGFTPGVQNATTQPSQCFQASIEGSMGTSPVNPFRGLSKGKRSFSASNTQLGRRDKDGASNEDCLFLNVHVPTTPKTKSLLPVIVYIHGGGYDAGNVSLYPVHDFVHASDFGLVSVNIQYRLGLFGFLSGQKVKNDGALNTGLLDQNFALQWVQRNIHLFGGDRTKVTIYGQSAGAGSVLQHIVAHGGKTHPPLFRAAMMNSPFLPFQYAFNDPIPEALFSKVLSQVKCNKAKDALACLRTVPASLLLEADTKIGLSNFFGTYSFVPVVDGDFITERPMVTLNRGCVNGHTLTVSSNADEGLIFTPKAALISNKFTLSDYITQLFPRLNRKQIAQAVQIYSKAGTTVPEQASAVMGDSIFVCPAYAAVRAFGKNGYKAMFALPPATHAEDLSYEFANFGLPPTFSNPAFFNAWQQTFLDTAMFLNPNIHFDPTNITPDWPTWSAHRVEMLFNKTEANPGLPVVKTTTTSLNEAVRCGFWASLSAVIAQ